MLIIVKAEVVLQWKSNREIEDYRFYYPYQELLLGTASKEKEEEPASSGIITILYGVVVILVVALILLALTKCYRRYYKVPTMLVEEDHNISQSG